ncbi:MAG: hypothetical protein LLG06_09460 [Desulfobacteraceae bacterium]|nr:hypothetical protein [Desulfobacteraceae bacterium]
MKKILIAAFLAISFLTGGCQTTGALGQSGMVPANDRISVAAGQQSALWEGPDLSVEFRYSRTGSDMDLRGNAIFADSLQYGYGLLVHFVLRAVFTDDAGRVLQTVGLATDRGSFDPVPFQKRFVLPPSATYVSFSYDGMAQDTGEDSGGNQTRFWHVPTR